ncbi:benK [Symbiodinium pilosum]|uniref:BenK protein n=1 Tax=Symbiodinium pilosum TaxID=2952 RepID=A0A812WD09_SYMPI|nr:benK [Symbiodinium pilosum]
MGVVALTSTLGNVVEASRQMRTKSTHTVQSICERVLASELVPFEATKMTFQGQELEGRQQLGFYRMTQGSALNVHVEISKELLCHQMSGLLKERGLSLTELGDLYCYRYGAPARRALELLGLRCTLKEFLASAPEYFHIVSGCITSKALPPAGQLVTGDLNQRYLQLDTRIAECKSVKDASAALEQVVRSVEGTSLTVGRAIFLGSVARGTAIEGNADAKAVLLLKGMAAADRQKWLLSSLTMLAAALSKDFGEGAQVSVADDAVHVRFTGASVEVVLDAIGGPVALAADRSARVFEKLPPAVKVTMRLMKWWRNQQQWSSDEERPCDLFLEKIIASTAAHVPSDQAAAVATALNVLASLEQLKVMDPMDSTVNLADSKNFNYKQLVQLASQSAGRLMQ